MLPATEVFAGMFFLSHTFARHRPKNGAAATIAKATPNTIRIRHLLILSGFFAPPRYGALHGELRTPCTAPTFFQLSAPCTNLDIPHPCYPPAKGAICLSQPLAGSLKFVTQTSAIP